MRGIIDSGARGTYMASNKDVRNFRLLAVDKLGPLAVEKLGKVSARIRRGRRDRVGGPMDEREASQAAC